MHYSLTLLLQMIRFLLFFHSQKNTRCQRLKRDVYILSPKHFKRLLSMKFNGLIFTLFEVYFLRRTIQLILCFTISHKYCAKYTIKSLTEASLQTPVSEKTHVKMCTERTKLTETLTKERI